MPYHLSLNDANETYKHLLKI